MKQQLQLLLLLLLVAAGCPVSAQAQATAKVTGSYTLIVSENDNITFREAKRRCVELAKAEAIKKKFGEMVTSDVINTSVEDNGESSSFFWENTVAKAKGDWLGDTKKPLIDIQYSEGNLYFTANVWGEAREIVQAKVDLRWAIMRDGNNRKEVTLTFNDNERVYVELQAPEDGYVAVYLIEGNDETSCLLPYPKGASRFPVKGGQKYVFFDKEEDPKAVYYRLRSKKESEDHQIVVIYSPHSFPKCTDITVNAMRPNWLSTTDFQKWLLKCQRADRDMVVEKRWIKIRNSQDTNSK